MFEDFWGNTHVARALERMIHGQRIPQTLLFAGPEGLGKATLARRFAAELLGQKEKIEHDDLSLPHNTAIITTREKWPPDKRNEDPLLFASHPDFVTFPPEGPLRQLSLPQMRMLKERAPFKPLKGSRRIFLVDHLDRAGEQAAQSLLKTLEEPPEHLILILTAENGYDLLPTIRSRAVPFYFAPLSDTEMQSFFQSRKVDDPKRRMVLSAGSPGVAVNLDLAAYEKRRSAMLALLQVAGGIAPFQTWLAHSEAISRSKNEKLELYLKILYDLLRDLLLLTQATGQQIRNQDARQELERLAQCVEFSWIRAAVKKVDELVEALRRNIQKTIALDSMIVELRSGNLRRS